MLSKKQKELMPIQPHYRYLPTHLPTIGQTEPHTMQTKVDLILNMAVVEIMANITLLTILGVSILAGA